MGKECCSWLSRSLWGGKKIHALLKTPAWEASTFYSISMDWSESEGSYSVAKTQLPFTGLSLGGDGWRFPLAIMNMFASYFHRKIEEK